MSIDREYRLKIVTTSEGGGAQTASQEMENLGKETHKTNELHKGLHGVVRQLQREFPELGHLMHAAFNPVTLVVGSAIASVELYKQGIEETTKAISSTALADFPLTNIHRASRMTQALQEMATAIRQVADAYNSVEASSDRQAKKLEKQLELVKALLESRKDLIGLAQFEANAELLKIENDRAKADAMDKEARAKQKKAGGIHVNSAEDEAASMAKLSENAAKASADLEEVESVLSDLRRYQEGRMGLGESTAYALDYVKKYHMTSPKDLEGYLEGKKESSLNTIQQFEVRQMGAQERSEQRKIKEELISQATKEAGDAAAIRAGLPDRQSGVHEGEMQRYWFEQLQMGRNPSIRGNTLLGNVEGMEALSFGEKITPGQVKSMDQLVQILRDAGNNNDKISQILKMMFDTNVAHKQKLEALESGMAKLGNVVRYSFNTPR